MARSDDDVTVGQLLPFEEEVHRLRYIDSHGQAAPGTSASGVSICRDDMARMSLATPPCIGWRSCLHQRKSMVHIQGPIS